MKKRTRLIAGVMAMMLTLGGCGSAANTANKKEATQTTAEQTAVFTGGYSRSCSQKKQNWMF